MTKYSFLKSVETIFANHKLFDDKTRVFPDISLSTTDFLTQLSRFRIQFSQIPSLPLVDIDNTSNAVFALKAVIRRG